MWWWVMGGWARLASWLHSPQAPFQRTMYLQVWSLLNDIDLVWLTNSCSVFDNYIAAISVAGTTYELGLFDTAGWSGMR